jgi:hypothetical protein
MVHTIHNLETSKLNPGFEFHQLLVSLKHVINLVMQIRYTGCHSPPPKNKISSQDLKGENVIKEQRTIAHSLSMVAQSPDDENGENPRFPRSLLLQSGCSIVS